MKRMWGVKKVFSFMFLALTISILLTACGGGGGSDGGSNPPPSSGGGALLFTVTNNPSTGNDWAYDIAIDSNYMYVVGTDNSSGDEKWRIEKRNLSDGALVSGFGTAGVVISDPSGGSAVAMGITIDSTYMYVVGSDNSTGNYQWRIEKRNLSDGQLVSGFGTAGVVTNDPSTAGDGIYGIAIDSTYMYVVGYDSSLGAGDQQWRIEKRNLSDGQLVSGFGTGGVVTNNPSTGCSLSTTDDGPYSIAIDSNYMYVAGWDCSSPIGKQWRIEKRLLSTGALHASFGINGIITNNPDTGGDDEAYGIAIDSTYMYVVGYDNASIDQQRRIEKRNLSNGALVTSFGTGGVVTTNPSGGSDGAFSIAIDSTYMYVAGYDSSPGNAQWRIEKRNLSDGQLAASFGTGGVVTSNPGTGVDIAIGIAIDSTYMYVVGGDSSPGAGDEQWRIEKRSK